MKEICAEAVSFLNSKGLNGRCPVCRGTSLLGELGLPVLHKEGLGPSQSALLPTLYTVCQECGFYQSYLLRRMNIDLDGWIKEEG